MIIPASSSTDLLEPHYDSVFLLSGTTKIEARRGVAVLDRMGTRRLAVVDDGTSFPATLTAATVESVRQPDSTISLAGQHQLIRARPVIPASCRRC